MPVIYLPPCARGIPCARKRNGGPPKRRTAARHRGGSYAVCPRGKLRSALSDGTAVCGVIGVFRIAEYCVRPDLYAVDGGAAGGAAAQVVVEYPYGYGVFALQKGSVAGERLVLELHRRHALGILYGHRGIIYGRAVERHLEVVGREHYIAQLRTEAYYNCCGSRLVGLEHEIELELGGVRIAHIVAAAPAEILLRLRAVAVDEVIAGLIAGEARTYHVHYVYVLRLHSVGRGAAATAPVSLKAKCGLRGSL